MKFFNRPAKERLRGYFRFSNRRHTLVCEDGQRPSSRHSLHPNCVAGGSNSGGTPRSRTGSSNSGNGSTTAVVAGGSSSDPRSPKSNNDNAVPLDSPDLISSTSYSPYNTSLMPWELPKRVKRNDSRKLRRSRQSSDQHRHSQSTRKPLKDDDGWEWSFNMYR